jgi:hypothetical protein
LRLGGLSSHIVTGTTFIQTDIGAESPIEGVLFTALSGGRESFHGMRPPSP